MRHRGRGRPKEARETNDLGTKELRSKRAEGLTEERLDRYYRMELITEKQYWCGNHFRWLYTMRYGIPNIRAVDPSECRIPSGQQDNEAWKGLLNAQYKEAEQLLQHKQLLSVLLDVVVYSHCETHPGNQLRNAPDFVPALDILVDLWC